MYDGRLEYLRDMLLGKKTIEDTDPDAILYKDVFQQQQRIDKYTRLPFSIKEIKTPPTAKELGIESLL